RAAQRPGAGRHRRILLGPVTAHRRVRPHLGTHVRRRRGTLLLRRSAALSGRPGAAALPAGVEAGRWQAGGGRGGQGAEDLRRR
nr:hypothetical protein [Tanacetum cinerariifolium]